MKLERCFWCGEDPLYMAYHDTEWGQVNRDERHLFEMLSLELFQSGLSWLTILRKREAFRRAFAGFAWQEISTFGSEKIEELMADSAIVRNRKKIEAVIQNARQMPGLLQVGSFADFLWQFEPKERQIPIGGHTRASLPLLIPEAHQLSYALKARGFSFCGPMVCMSLMQAVGILNDHLRGCYLCPYSQVSE